MNKARGVNPPTLNADLPLCAFPPVSEVGNFNASEHFVQFYEDDLALLDATTRFIGDGLRDGDACIVIGTGAHRGGLAARLRAHGLDVVNNGLGDRYFAFDAHETLARFCSDGTLDSQLFDNSVGEIVKQASGGGRRVRAFGEMVALLTEQGNFAAAVQLEELWNDLRRKHEFGLFCAYPLSSFGGDQDNTLIQVCQKHARVIPAESYNALPNTEARLRTIVALQQKALALESEIAERQRAESEVRTLLVSEQRARVEAELANCLRDEFLATVSHELRTPLNAIIGWAHMLRCGKLDHDATARAVETIERNARVQAHLVEDLLDVSRIITGKLRLSVARVDVAAIVSAAIESVRPAATSKEIQIQLTLDPVVRCVSGDAGRLQQIVWNLLSNAVKFTPAKGRVEVLLRPKDNGLEIVVCDSGQGLEPAFLPFIFDRFRQADTSTTRSCGGLGLGLSIARHLVELHGGTIAAESPGPGKGSTFTITLPNAIARDGQLETANRPRGISPSDAPPGENPFTHSIASRQILLVDDDEDTLSVMAEVLRGHGANVEVAKSAREAIEVLNHFHADVIVSDLAMAEDDGYSLIQMIRAPENGDRELAQAIALTALVRVEDRVRALSGGSNICLLKPVRPDQLVRAIADLTASAG